jgi:RNA polymerase sigma-70 factor (ECF subfamily)
MHDAFEANSLDLLHYFERRVSPPEDAADLLSETMLVAWRKVGTLPREPESARMWLFTIARYVLLNHHRGQRRQNSLADTLRREIIRTHQSDQAQQAESVLELLATLPRTQAELLRLVHWDGFTVAEAAQLLGVSRATGRRHYDTAIVAMRTGLSMTSTGVPLHPC